VCFNVGLGKLGVLQQFLRFVNRCFAEFTIYFACSLDELFEFFEGGFRSFECFTLTAVFLVREILGKNIVGTILPELNIDGIPYSERLKIFAENPEKLEFRELESILKDGTSKWVAWTNKTIYNSEGEVIEILSVGLDITSLKRTEQKLASEKAHAQLYFDNAGVMLVVLDVSLKISKINKKCIKLLGYDEEELIGLDWCENFILKRDQETIKKYLKLFPMVKMNIIGIIFSIKMVKKN